MTIKEFQAGQIAYILCMHTGYNQEPTLKEITVKSVGRKYVTVNNGVQYFQRDDSPYGLVEKCNLNSRTLLCPTKGAAEKYIEWKKLSIWLYEVGHFNKQYTLDQLRQVKKILLPDANTTDCFDKSTMSTDMEHVNIRVADNDRWRLKNFELRESAIIAEIRKKINISQVKECFVLIHESGPVGQTHDTSHEIEHKMTLFFDADTADTFLGSEIEFRKTVLNCQGIQYDYCGYHEDEADSHAPVIVISGVKYYDWDIVKIVIEKNAP